MLERALQRNGCAGGSPGRRPYPGRGVPSRSNRATWRALIKRAGRGGFFVRMVREIEADLGAGSRRNLSRIEAELVRAFAAAATQLQFINHQILLGEGSEIDLAGFSQLASTMLRIGSRLGTERRSKQVLDMNTFLEVRRRERGETPEEEIS
jgi:hypothetical protein